MTEIRITEEKEINAGNNSVLLRAFSFRNGNKNCFGFEMEYTDNDSTCRKVFKDAADSPEEIHRIITSLAENEVLPSSVEEVMEEILAGNSL